MSKKKPLKLGKNNYNYKSQGKGILTEYNSSLGGDVKWEAEQGMVTSDPLKDNGEGKAVIVRSFEFRFPPGMKGLPTKEQILTPEYIKHLEVRLWADEIEMIAAPRVTINSTGFFVFATCQVKKGSILPYNAKPKQLQEITNGTKGNS